LSRMPEKLPRKTETIHTAASTVSARIQNIHDTNLSRRPSRDFANFDRNNALGAVLRRNANPHSGEWYGASRAAAGGASRRSSSPFSGTPVKGLDPVYDVHYKVGARSRRRSVTRGTGPKSPITSVR
jgi:hypothetical protein